MFFLSKLLGDTVRDVEGNRIAGTLQDLVVVSTRQGVYPARDRPA
jgi:hypothetical protein